VRLQAVRRHKFNSPEEEILMVRKLLLMLGLCLLVSVSAHAQSVNVFGGYSYLRFRGTPAGNFNGWHFAGEYKFKRFHHLLGAVGDVSGDYGSPTNVSSSVRTYMVGPQVSYSWKISPFAHALVGAGHFSQGSFGSTSLSEGYGAGVDTKIFPRISWRILEGDVIHTHFFGTTQNDLRLSTGIVIHF
jgi:hypothetical protein